MAYVVKHKPVVLHEKFNNRIRTLQNFFLESAEQQPQKKRKKRKKERKKKKETNKKLKKCTDQ